VVAPVLAWPAWGKHAGVSYAARAPAEPTERWLRRHGGPQLRALSGALESAGDNPGYRRAADAYDAAALLADRPQDLLDLVASIVLTRDGLAAITKRTARPRPPCFLNPLHRCSSGIRQWRGVSFSCPHTEVPACSPCGSASHESGRLLLRTLDFEGNSRPYFHVEGYWARTGFGAFEPDLPRRVLERLKVD
jgi:hypothetical protein